MSDPPPSPFWEPPRCKTNFSGGAGGFMLISMFWGFSAEEKRCNRGLRKSFLWIIVWFTGTCFRMERCMTELIHTMFGCLQSLLSPLLSQNGPSYSEQGSQFSGLKVISTLHLIAKRCCSSFCATFPCQRKKNEGKTKYKSKSWWTSRWNLSANHSIHNLQPY